MVAPQPQLHALLHVIDIASIESRAAAWSTESTESLTEKARALSVVASLMDAIHNIPLYLDNWEKWDEKAFLNISRCHDEKWRDQDVAMLETVYDDALRRFGQ